MNKHLGFTLLEVLVAFSILAVLLTVLMQSQAETTYFLKKTRKLDLVQKEVINKLLSIERTLSKGTIEAANGKFEEDHVLAGDRWELEVVQEDFMSIVPVMKITYRVYWTPAEGKEEQSFESSIIGEVK